MSKRDPVVALRDICLYAGRAMGLAQQHRREDLATDWQAGLLAQRVLEVLGEAVKRLPTDLRERHPQVPWRDWAGIRDRITHGYDNIDYAIVWESLHTDAPALLEQAKRILFDEFGIASTP